MGRQLNTTNRLITSDAACWLWRKSSGRLRQLALKGELPHRWTKVHGIRVHAYSVDALIERWGVPDRDTVDLDNENPDKPGALLRLELMQMGGGGRHATWVLFMPRPSIETASGDLAVDLGGGE